MQLTAQRVAEAGNVNGFGMRLRLIHSRGLWRMDEHHELALPLLWEVISACVPPDVATVTQCHLCNGRMVAMPRHQQLFNCRVSRKGGN